MNTDDYDEFEDDEKDYDYDEYSDDDDDEWY